jgi:hypothetical protein
MPGVRLIAYRASVARHGCAYRSTSMRLSPLLLLCASALLFGCSRTPKEEADISLAGVQDPAQIVEDSRLMQDVCLNILSALDSGDIEKARKFAETPMLVDASTLPYYAARSQLIPAQKKELIKTARKVLDYMEQHKQELKGRNRTRPALLGLQEILTDPDEVRRLQALSDYCAAEDKR